MFWKLALVQYLKDRDGPRSPEMQVCMLFFFFVLEGGATERCFCRVGTWGVCLSAHVPRTLCARYCRTVVDLDVTQERRDSNKGRKEVG